MGVCVVALLCKVVYIWMYVCMCVCVCVYVCVCVCVCVCACVRVRVCGVFQQMGTSKISSQRPLEPVFLQKDGVLITFLCAPQQRNAGSILFEK